MSKTIPINKPDLSTLAERWPSPLIARAEVERFTGGLITSKYLANLDSQQGKGPAGRIRIGRKVCYRVDALISWLESRAETL
jgi:hypothetical protein